MLNFLGIRCMVFFFTVLVLTKEFASLENQIELVGAFLGLGKAVLMNLFTMHSRPLISVDSSWINAWHAFSFALI